MSYLIGIGTANPIYKHSQETVSDFYCNSVDGEDENVKRKIRIVSKKTGIRNRYSVLKDFSNSADKFEFFPPQANLEPLPNLSKRMEIFKSQAPQLALSAIKNIPEFDTVKTQITHIITVTCTGLFAPGLDIELMQLLELSPRTQRNSINFMGCNAAILALKQADQICRAEENAMVLVVCTELCTLHFQKEYTDDYILSNLIFADGSAAALICSEKKQLKNIRPLKINQFHSLILHEGYKDMAWQLSEKGFIMNLTSYVSGILNKNIKGLLNEAGVDQTAIDHWAIHPGGKRILDEFSQLLNLEQKSLSQSYSVLEEYGNMSSATILFVLKTFMSDVEIKPKQNIFTAAFGPGLSIESVMLEYV